MLASAIPYKFKTPWASDATAPQYVTSPIPAVSVGPAAGQDLGFPPATATDPSAGGTPPNINDVNGALNYETLWSQWLQAGAPVGYDATFSSNIGGYPRGAIIRSATFGQFWLSTADNNTSNPDTGGANWVSAYSGRLIGIQTFTASSTYTPTAGMKTVIFEVQGGGAAGGGCGTPTAGNIDIGAPGTAGSYAMGEFSAATVGASQSVTIGAGATGASGSSGGNGGTSSVGSLIIAPGGVGGLTIHDAGVPNASANGSFSTAPTGGNIVSARRSATSPSLAMTALFGGGYGGQGGSTKFGDGGPPTPTGAAGQPGGGHGAGGGGTVTNNGLGNVVGGSGVAGVVIAWEYS